MADVTQGVVLSDAGYGDDTSFRDGLTAMDLTYVAGVQSSIPYGRQAGNCCRSTVQRTRPSIFASGGVGHVPRRLGQRFGADAV
ncbi:hypothetical protein RFM98_30720 [Mesorhizobium sp. VK9D]|uniref:transposase n=1 Tax=Mesorhizobium australafricanum TaxID=3072311 RepID=UPI002A249532|nr:transposase [Mesorhizobium sp. VK9D]MDX8457110.1 hypothetical protein [Mesorhizobium sp. VK9D]